jgi:hypothetical protein
MLPIISTISLRQMASGDRLFLQVYKFIGANPGKKVYIQSNLHGAEISGNAVIHQLIEFLLSINDTDLVGEIWLIPVCNHNREESAKYFLLDFGILLGEVPQVPLRCTCGFLS